MTIKINGEKHEVSVIKVSYETVLILAGFDMEGEFTVTYQQKSKKGSQFAGGILNPGDTVKVTDNMIFKVF